MKSAVAVFVKTFGLSPLKTRLAAGIGRSKADEFYLLCLAAIEETLRSAEVDIYWAVAEKEGLNAPMWQAYPCLYAGAGDLGECQHHVYESLLKQYDKVLMIGSDTPQLSNKIISQVLLELEHEKFVISPAHDGGYYLFGGKSSIPLTSWQGITWSAETTLKELEQRLTSKFSYIDTLTDIDEWSDLEDMIKQMLSVATETQNAVIKLAQSLLQL